MNPELVAKIAIWRAKAADGTITLDEMREAVAAMREGRLAAANASDQARRKRAKAAVRSADDLLNELGGL